MLGVVMKGSSEEKWMRGALVTWCVGISVALLASCESSKAPKNEQVPAAPVNEAAPVVPASQLEKPKAGESKPVIAEVPTAPLAMQKLEDAKEDAKEDAAVQGAAISLEAAFPERRVPTEKLSDKMAKRLRYKLRDVTKAPIALRHFIQVPNPDGSLEVFAIYEYGVLESCVRGYPTRKQGRAACFAKGLSSDCVKLGAVRAHFGAPKEGTSMETSGALTVAAMELQGTNCSADEELVFVDDVDRDGKLEMLIDLTTSDVSGVQSREPAYWEYRRQLAVFGGDEGRDPFQLWVDVWDTAEPADVPLSPLASDLEMGDFNHDGHLDFLRSESPECDLRDEQNIHLDGAKLDAKIAWCAKQPRIQSVFLYDLKNDQWEASEALSAARTAKAAVPATPPSEPAKAK
jgi:hypothetical protein